MNSSISWSGRASPVTDRPRPAAEAEPVTEHLGPADLKVPKNCGSLDGAASDCFFQPCFGAPVSHGDVETASINKSDTGDFIPGEKYRHNLTTGFTRAS